MAGGKGSRLSPRKPLLEVCSIPMIARVYNVAEKISTDIYIATIKNHVIEKELILRFPNIIYTSGKGYENDVLEAVTTIGFPVLVLPSDIPFLKIDYVKPLFTCKSSICTLLSRGKFVGISLWNSDNLNDFSSIESNVDIINVNTKEDLSIANKLCYENI
ncbi:NTP transferase domain-containing protein [Acidianus brierleyi]|uniref:Cobalamin biosynthesis protein CobY n=2 Tax=Acidianus brierleyi TaxID=41673 RepID=A0A2U9IIK5_9CREN|nr:NTP transferase domain-containing protein [Acidianus brierleyi]